jgi:hypothetical protein
MSELKERFSTSATYSWLGIIAALITVDDGVAGLLSVKALVLLLGGMFVAAICVGSINYWLSLKLLSSDLGVRLMKWRLMASSFLRWTIELGFPLYVYYSLFWLERYPVFGSQIRTRPTGLSQSPVPFPTSTPGRCLPPLLVARPLPVRP